MQVNIYTAKTDSGYHAACSELALEAEAASREEATQAVVDQIRDYLEQTPYAQVVRKLGHGSGEGTGNGVGSGSSHPGSGDGSGVGSGDGSGTLASEMFSVVGIQVEDVVLG